MHTLRGRVLALAASFLIPVGVLFTAISPAAAHEARTIGNGQFKVEVGWGTEPPYAGSVNKVQMFIHDTKDKPITDVGDGLQVELVFGTQKSAPFALKAADPDSGTPGEYDAAVIPDRPGTYSFHIIGTIHGTKIDETFTSSDKTFDDVNPVSDVAFPAKDPTNGDLATRLDRVSTRADAANAAAKKAKDDASQLAVIAIVVGVVALVVGGAAIGMARRPRG